MRELCIFGYGCVLVVIPFLCIFVKIYLKLTTGWCKSHTCLERKTVIITGATSGIGYETALDLAKRGARVILGCIDEREGEEARLKIIRETGNEDVKAKLIDLASFRSVRAFAREINMTEDRLDILINNAGVAGIGDRKTQDGCLYTMQVNYFSTFLLTHLLLGLMKKSKNGRIINVASLVAKRVDNLDVTKLNDYPGHYHPVYTRSKLCIILFTIKLAKQLKEIYGITTYSVHPGVINSLLFNNVHGLGKALIFLGKPFFKTCEEGAQTTIHCAVSKGIEKYNGEHFEDCNKVPRYKTASNFKLAEDLWERTKDIVKLKPEEEF